MKTIKRVKELNLTHLKKADELLQQMASDSIESDYDSHIRMEEAFKKLYSEYAATLWDLHSEWRETSKDIREAGGIYLLRPKENLVPHYYFSNEMKHPRSVVLSGGDFRTKFIAPMVKFVKTYDSSNPEACALADFQPAMETIAKKIASMSGTSVMKFPYDVECCFTYALRFEKDVIKVYSGTRAFLLKALLHDKKQLIRLVNAITSQRFITGHGKVSEEG